MIPFPVVLHSGLFAFAKCFAIFIVSILFLSAIICKAQFKILNNGNVGISTTNPLSLFQIYDDFKKVSFGSATSLTDGINYQGFNAVRQSNGNRLSQTNGTKNGGELQPGMYLYSLIIDGKEMDTKRMILTE